MGTDKKLSHVLRELGLRNVLNTREFPGMSGAGILVEAKTPNTVDSNNGTTVVYDEQGRPWVIRNSHLTDEGAKALRPFNLKWGAHVPHSNDGGVYIRSSFPDK